MIGSAVFVAALAGCGARAAEDELAFLSATGGKMDAGDHFVARHCEIFVDKVLAMQGSHALKYLTFFVKTLNDRLDGDVAGVGFWNQSRDAASGRHEPWHDSRMTPYLGASEYFQLGMPIAHDWGRFTYEGVFYVQTVRGTTYWLKPEGTPTENFIIDLNGFNNVMNAMGVSHNYTDDLDRAASTQTGLSYYNPDRCY